MKARKAVMDFAPLAAEKLRWALQPDKVSTNICLCNSKLYYIHYSKSYHMQCSLLDPLIPHHQIVCCQKVLHQSLLYQCECVFGKPGPTSDRISNCKVSMQIIDQVTFKVSSNDGLATPLDFARLDGRGVVIVVERFMGSSRPLTRADVNNEEVRR